MRVRVRSLGLLAAGMLSGWVGFGTKPIEAAVGSTDYTVTALSGLYEAPPASAVAVSGSGTGARVDLPFEFSYFGALYDHVVVNIGSVMLFGNDNTNVDTAVTSYAIQSVPPTIADGACAPFWCCLQTNSLSKIKTWVAGTSPNRRFIASWEDCAPLTGTGNLTFQVRLFETSQRVEFAYKPDTTPSTWSNCTYSCGMLAPGSDQRFVAPVNTLTTNTGHPANDYRFDPRFTTVSGRLLYERRTPTAAGLPAGTTAAALGRVQIELRHSTGRPFGRTVTDADGNFQITGTAGSTGPGAISATVVAQSAGPSSIVKVPAALAAPEILVSTPVFTNVDLSYGTRTIDAASDPAATFRGAVNVACAIQRAADWLSARTSLSAGPIVVAYDPASANATSYTSNPDPTVVIAGPGAANDDTWDDAVIIRTFARYLQSRLVGTSEVLVTSNLAFDAATDDRGAFAVGFGHFLAAAVTGQSVYVDTSGPSTATTYDLESPQPVTPKGPNVAAWVASALYDLFDAANEPADLTDGSGDGGAGVAKAIDALASTPTAATFLESWCALGFDGPGASRLWIANGLVADDASETNDAATESALLGPLGTRKDGLTLNAGNEDWFEATVAGATSGALAEVTFPRTATPATIELEVLTAGGARVAGVVDGGTGPISLSLGSLSAGTYRLRVAHVGGKRVPDYTLQFLQRLQMDHTALPSWTAGIPYQRSIAIDGGIGAPAFALQSGTAPTGLLFDAANERVSGTPVQTGVFDFTLAVTDAGNPQHTDIATHHVVINGPLNIDLGEFVPFALGKTVDVTRAHAGGTEPLDVEASAGPPAGLLLSATGLRFTGMPTIAGSTRLAIRATDVAGSADDMESTAVVCVAAPAAKTPADLAAGPSACGFFFDGVAGSSVKFAAATAPKRLKRGFRAVVIGRDGAQLDGAAVKPGTGKASGAVAALPVTGRYFVVFASDAGEATQLLGTVTVTAPKSVKETIENVKSGDVVSFRFGALAGATLSMKATPEKASGLSLAVLALIDPNGTAVPLQGIASQKGTSALLATPLGLSGTWTVRLRATGPNSGSVTSSLKLAQPKGGAYSAD